MPVWEVHIKHRGEGWSIIHLEAPDQETAEADAWEKMFEFYSPKSRAEAEPKAYVTRAIAFPDWGFLENRPKQPLTSTDGLSYSGSKARRKANRKRRRTMATDTGKKDGPKTEVPKAEEKPKKVMVTVNNLAEEFGKESRIIRRELRKMGNAAPKGEDTSNRYEWEPKDPALKEIRASLKKAFEPKPEPAKEEPKAEKGKEPAKAS